MKVFYRRFPLHERRVELLVDIDGVQFADWYDEPSDLSAHERQKYAEKKAARMVEKTGLKEPVELVPATSYAW